MVTPKNHHFTAVGSFSVKTVPDRHRLAVYCNKTCWQAFKEYQHWWPWTTM